MNARDNIKPKTIRLAILIALSDGAIATIDDLQDRMDEPRAKIASNVHPTMAEGLIKRLRDDVTSLPAYQITPKGREYLASFAGGKAEVAMADAVDEHSVIRNSRTTELDDAQKDAEIERLTQQRDAWRDAIGDISGEDTPQSAAQFISDLKGRAAGIISMRDEKAQCEIADLRKQLAHVINEANAAIELSRLARASAEPVGYVVQRSIKPMVRFTKQEKAQSYAINLARLGQRLKVFALIPVGVAVPGAEWRPA